MAILFWTFIEKKCEHVHNNKYFFAETLWLCEYLEYLNNVCD